MMYLFNRPQLMSAMDTAVAARTAGATSSPPTMIFNGADVTGARVGSPASAPVRAQKKVAMEEGPQLSVPQSLQVKPVLWCDRIKMGVDITGLGKDAERLGRLPHVEPFIARSRDQNGAQSTCGAVHRLGPAFWIDRSRGVGVAPMKSSIARIHVLIRTPYHGCVQLLHTTEHNHIDRIRIT